MHAIALYERHGERLVLHQWPLRCHRLPTMALTRCSRKPQGTQIYSETGVCVAGAVIPKYGRPNIEDGLRSGGLPTLDSDHVDPESTLILV